MAPHQYAIFSAQYLPSMGGVELFSDNLARKLVREGHQVTVVASARKDAPAREDRDGFQVVRLPAAQLLDGRLPVTFKDAAYRRIWGRLLDEDVDRVLVNTRFYPHSLEGLRFAAEKGAPAVMLEHGSAHLSFGIPAADAVVERWEHLVTARARAARPVFAGVSLAACSWLEHFGIKTDVVINNAIDAAAFRDASSGRDFRAELGIAPDAFTACFVGRFVAEKGPLAVLDAARLLPEVSFVMAGAGPEEDHIRAVADYLPNVSLVGRLGREDVSALFSSADCFVLPSVYPEGLPTVLLEAGAWGCLPVICPVGGVADVLGDSGWGEICGASADEVTAAIARLAVLPAEERARRSAAFRERVETGFTWAHTAAQLDAAFSCATEGRHHLSGI